MDDNPIISRAREPRYLGPERRKHKVFVTRHTEYHFRESLCVAVRDRATGQWLPGHVALNRPLSGSLKFAPNGGIRPSLGPPVVGESLFFGTAGRDLVTSPLVAIERPAKALVEQYPRPPHRGR